mgnify:CR=1 FL=1
MSKYNDDILSHYGIKKTAATEKAPIFSKFEKTVSAREIEALFIKNYPEAVKGSLKIDTKVKGNSSYGRIYCGLSMDRDTTNLEEWETPFLTGSVVTAIEPGPRGIRVYSYVNIDG